MKIELDIKIRRQLILAWCILLTTIISISFTIFNFVSSVEEIINKKKGDDYNFNSFSIIIAVVASLIYVALWVTAIVNAISINNITNSSTLLIIFTVINFSGIAMLIVSVMERKKVKSWDENQLNNKIGEHPVYSNKKNALKHALMSDVINSKEYNEKLKALEETFEKKDK